MAHHRRYPMRMTSTNKHRHFTRIGPVTFETKRPLPVRHFGGPKPLVVFGTLPDDGMTIAIHANGECTFTHVVC